MWCNCNLIVIGYDVIDPCLISSTTSIYATSLSVCWCLIFLLEIFRSTPLSGPNKAGLDVCLSVHTYVDKYVRMYVRPSITESSSDSNEIWYTGRGWWLMHDGMPYGLIQDRGHVALKVRNSSIFKISPPPFSAGAGIWLLILKLEENV